LPPEPADFTERVYHLAADGDQVSDAIGSSNSSGRLAFFVDGGVDGIL
jgi:hypothetical protein